jgi:hypothetical protein
MPPVLTSFDDLANLLARDKTNHRLDREAQAIELPTSDPALPGNLYIRWDKKLPFVQLIQMALQDIPESRIADVQRAIVVLNNEIEMPGFGMDEAARRVYFRVVVAVVPPHGVDAETLYQLAQGTVRNAKLYQAAFKAVIDGKSGGDIVALAQASIAANPPPPQA